MEAAQETRDTLAPLSKRYRLTQEEAKAIPKNIQQYLQELKEKLVLCKNKKNKETLTENYWCIPENIIGLTKEQYYTDDNLAGLPDHSVKSNGVMEQ